MTMTANHIKWDGNNIVISQLFRTVLAKKLLRTQ